MIQKKLGRRISVLLLASILMMVGTISVFAVNAGGGTWDYGTKISGFNRKTAYSNYFHPTRVHKSSVSIGTLFTESGWTKAKKTSYASATGGWFDSTHAYYDYR